jgi:membrane protease YdiL (CAAX protease family)
VTLWHDDQGRLRPGWCFLLGIIVALIANYIAIGVAGPLSHRSTKLLELIYRPLTTVLLLAGYALLLMSADRVHERLLAAMGLGRFPAWVRQAAWGLAIGASLVTLAVVWIVVFGDLSAVTLTISSRTLGFAAGELFVLAAAAMGEELMFRGYPFQRLLEATGPVVAVIVMSSLFAFAHGGNPHASKLAIVNTFAIGALLCVAYLRTGALWMPWGIHFAWNTALGLVFGLPVSGLTEFAVLVRTRATGPLWVTGGAYGIEGSAVGTIVIVLGFVPVLLLTRYSAPVRLGLRSVSAPDSPAAATVGAVQAEPDNPPLPNPGAG